MLCSATSGQEKAHGQNWKRDDWKSRAKEFEVADYF